MRVAIGVSATLTNQKCAVLQVNALEATTIVVWQPAHFPHFRALSLDLYLSLVTPRSKPESFCSYPSSGFPHIWLSSCPQTRLFPVLSSSSPSCPCQLLQGALPVPTGKDLWDLLQCGLPPQS